MAQENYFGHNAPLFISTDDGTSWDRVGSLLEWTLSVETDPREVTTKDSAGWREFDPDALKEFSGSANGLTIDTANDAGRQALVDALMNGTILKARFNIEADQATGTPVTGSPEYVGDIIITSREISSPEEDSVASDISFQGTGALTEQDAS